MVSTIHLVDLAGSERVNRAKTVGERVKEASRLRQCRSDIHFYFDSIKVILIHH